MTVYEALEDAGLTAAAVNITCYRGRTEHLPTRRVPVLTRPALRAEAALLLQPLRVGRDGRAARRCATARAGRSTPTPRRSAAGSSRATASTSSSSTSPTTTTPRTRRGPDAAHAALARCDDAVGGLIEAAGGPDEFLERYAVILCSDHGQTQVDEVARLEDTFPDEHRDRVQPGRDGVLGRRSGRAGGAAGRPPRRRRRPLPRGRGGGRAPGRRGAAVHAGRGRAATPRSSTIPHGLGARLGRARESERRRADRLRRRRLGVRRPRRPAPLGRRLARLAARPATRRCRCSRSGSRRCRARSSR